jgi:hypothetical protein
MPIAVQMDFPGATLEMYDTACSKMGLSPKGPGPAGAISHFAAKTDSGIRVVDVWESQELFDKFGQDQIGPITQEVGFPNPPTTQILEVHNYFTPNV